MAVNVNLDYKQINATSPKFDQIPTNLKEMLYDSDSYIEHNTDIEIHAVTTFKMASAAILLFEKPMPYFHQSTHLHWTRRKCYDLRREHISEIRNCAVTNSKWRLIDQWPTQFYIIIDIAFSWQTKSDWWQQGAHIVDIRSKFLISKVYWS